MRPVPGVTSADDQQKSAGVESSVRMPPAVLFSALAQLTLLIVAAVSYWLASRRFPKLAHPLSILLFVTLVGVMVSAVGELRRDGWAGVPAMAARAAIGSAGWGAVIAGIAWVTGRRFGWGRSTRP
jgi:hypothetical protein